MGPGDAAGDAPKPPLPPAFLLARIPWGMVALPPAIAIRRQQAESLTRIPVRSSNVAAVAYSAEFGRLFIWFGVGKAKRTLGCYDKVPPDLYARLLNAKSKGTFVYDEIRGAKGQRAGDGKDAPPVDYLYPYTDLGGW